MRQRVERPVRHGRDRVRQHAHALGRLHQDDGEGEGRGCATGKGFSLFRLKFVEAEW